jgi:predicted nucleic acid-binding protein
LRLVVSDTGPVLHLHEIRALELLQRAGDILVPPAVDQELRRLVASWPESRPGWLVPTPLDEEARRAAQSWAAGDVLDPGEAEAVSLAQRMDADWLLSDDTAARVIATQLGIEVHGSLGVVLWAAAVGHLDGEAARETLNRLFRSSLWVSPRLRAEAVSALDEILGHQSRDRD